MSSAAAELLLKIKTVGDEAVDKLSDKFGKVGEAAAAAFAVITAVVIKSLLDYRQQEEAVNALTQAMVNQGIYSKELKDSYVKLGQELQKVSLYGDEQIIASEAILQSYLGQTKISKELLTATMDLAAAKKMDLATAADLVGKSIGTETNALKRSGVEITANASQAQKLSEVMAGLNKHFQGQAQAATEGLGAVTQLSNVMSDLYEEIGERLTPVVELFTHQLIKVGTNAEETTPYIDAFVFAVESLVMAGTIVSGVLQTIADLLTNVLGTTIRTVIALVEGEFVEAFNIMKDGVAQSFTDVVKNTEDTYDHLVQVDNAFVASKQENRDKEAALVAASNANTAAVAANFAAEEANKRLERDMLDQENAMTLLNSSEEQRALALVNWRIKNAQDLLKIHTDANSKMLINQQLFKLNEEKLELMNNERKLQNAKDTFATIATMSKSNNQTLASIGKAAAITQIAIETPVAIAKAMSAFPPPANFVAAGVVGVAMAAQAAQIAGVQLAEGGIVKATPGGVQATIGEGGQDEMVIPLDRAKEFGVGGGGGSQTIINFNGPVMGDETQAREFAMSVDRELLKLRRNNESVSFDSGVI